MRFIHRSLELVPMKPVRCPGCRLMIEGRHVWDERSCPACGAGFRIRRHFIVTNYVLALVISVGAGYAVGNRDEALVSLTLLLWFPVLWGMVLVSFWLFPIDVAMVRPGWTPGDSEVDRELERLFASLRERGVVIRSTTPELPAPEPDALTDDAPGGRLPLSTLKDPPVTLEGVMIAIAVTAVLAYELYTALEPHF